jgi:lysophospholipase L1-like esterase
VKIIGDSHLKGLAINLKQHLNSQFDVSSIIKPGAKTNQLLENQQGELKTLGKKDFLIVSTGTNDLDNPKTNINNIITPLMTFIKEFECTNIIIVNAPTRYDLEHDSVATSKRRKTVRYNEKLYRLLKSYSHVSIVEVASNRDHYTKHGLHLNKYGKEKHAKQIAVQINSDKRLEMSSTTSITLLWKENIEEEVLTKVGSLSNVTCDNVRRTSSRNKKTPIIRNDDFFMGGPNLCNVKNMVKLTIMHQNIRGLRNKINELIISTSEMQPHLICFSEHHIKDMELNTPHIPSYKLGATYSRNILKCGGVCIYIKENLEYSNIIYSHIAKNKT